MSIIQIFNYKKLGKYIRQIILSVKDAGIYEKNCFIISADHCGINTGHWWRTLEELETRFFLSMMQFDII